MDNRKYGETDSRTDKVTSIVDQCMVSMFVPAQSLVFDRFSKANGWTDGRMDRRTDGQTDVRMDRWTDGQSL